jgi:hypothetical protein
VTFDVNDNIPANRKMRLPLRHLSRTALKELRNDARLVRTTRISM